MFYILSIFFIYGREIMNFKQLTYFVTTVDEGSISAAARRLYMSQPPLSAQLKALEDELGCTLFERGSRKIALTDAGKVLYRRAVAMLDMERITAEEVRSCSDSDKGTVRIGIVSSVVCSIAVDKIKGFSEIYKNARFEITEANTYELIEKLKSGIINVAIIRTPFPDEGFEQIAIADDSIIAVADQSTVGENDSITIEQLAEHKLIMYRRWESILRQKFSQHQLIPNCVCINDDARTALSLAECGLGTAIMPESAITNCPAGLKKVKIIGCDIQSQIRAVYLSSGYLPECVKQFIDFLQKEVKKA